MLLPPACNLISTPIAWLWPGNLARGTLAILDGDPGLGKSLLTLDLAARLTTGRPWPDGTASPGPAPVLFLCDEDPDSVIQARLMALGADMRKTFIWPRLDDAGLPLLPSDINRLDKALKQTGAELVILDPVVSCLDYSVNVASDANVRRGLRPLVRLAQKHGCVILLVRHLHKGPGHNPLYRGAGSIAFVAACRLAWLVGRDPRVPGRYVLAQNKNNFAPLAPSLAYSLASPWSPFPESPLPHPPPSADPMPDHLARNEPEGVPEPELGASRSALHPPPLLVWHGPCTWTAHDLSVRRRPRPRQQRACAFLHDFLKDGPRPSTELWQAARARGFSRNTLRRAKDELQIACKPLNHHGKILHYWLLPSQKLPNPSTETPDLDSWLQKLENQFPPRNPREEVGNSKLTETSP